MSGKNYTWSKSGSSSWVNAVFYIVDVPGPVILGLPTCEALHLVTINCQLKSVVTAPVKVTSVQVANRKESKIASEAPTKAWKVLATDILEIKGRNYLILSEYFSNFPIVRELSGPVTAVAITDVIEDMCGIFGRPDQIRSDNCPQYASGAHFTAFCKSWGIKHVTSSPNYAKSNGLAERPVRWVKPVTKKCLKTSESIPQALLQMRATPIDAKLPSPAELLLNRRVATCLTSHTTENRYDGVHDRLGERRAKMTTSYNKTARKSALPPFYPGQPIRIIDKPSKTWFRSRHCLRKVFRAEIIHCRDNGRFHATTQQVPTA